MATQSELYSLAKSVGLSDASAKTAAAIAMAESKGDPHAHNTNVLTGDNSYGLWQINMIGNLGPDRRAKYGLSSNEQLFDPATNARVMAGESHNGTNWVPWSTWPIAYQTYMANPVTDQSHNPGWLDKLGRSIANSPIGLGITNGTNPITSTAQAAASAADTLGKATKWVSNSENWIRVGYVVGGSVLVVAGLVMVLQSTSTGRAIVGTASGITPPARAAKVARVGMSSKPGTASYDPK